jgi:Na+/H+-translocating membrane pyrophosphatase
VRKISETPEELMINKIILNNAIIADNVGDVMKDIAGPSVNMLIKFSAYFSLIIINFINI